ncbi:MAG: hypothetical protein ACJ8G2_09820 [Burkholderiales bacterium]
MNEPIWRFELRANVWHWERVETTGIVIRGDPFTSFMACMVDAEKNGFDPTTDAMRPMGTKWKDE